MNNRYFIKIELSGYKYSPQIETMDWYDDLSGLEYNMEHQLTETIWKLSDMRGKYMKKLGRKGIDWFKKQVDKNIFHCNINVIKFNNSFDDINEFSKWCSDNGIKDDGIWRCVLPGDIEHRKALQDFATEYYLDVYDCNLNKTDSLSHVYGEFGYHRRSCADLEFKSGDILSYDKCGNYKVIDIPQKYNSLYWHDGCVSTHNMDAGDNEYEFDWPELLERR